MLLRQNDGYFLWLEKSFKKSLPRSPASLELQNEILIQEVSDSESYGKGCFPQIENHKILSCWIIQFYLILNF